MRYWEKPLRSIFKLAALPLLNKIRPKSLESVLENSISFLNEETADEIRHFIRAKQTSSGGFADRAGKSDLYYSLFGYFLARTFAVHEVTDALKDFVKKEITSKNLSGVHLFCGAILHSKLFASDKTSEKLRKEIIKELSHQQISSSANQHINPSAHQHIEYSSFMGYLALYYLEDYLSLKHLTGRFKKHISTSTDQHISTSAPCPVVSANSILLNLSGNKDNDAEEKIKAFYHENGGFIAVKNAPCEDLLSTGIALYALNFINADIRLLKPQCLNFVDDLYDNGGFRATQSDFETDVEYTFYGLLALGSLK